MCTDVWVFNFVLLVYIFFVAAPYWFLWLWLSIYLENWNGLPSSFVLSVQDCFGYIGSFVFHINFWTDFLFYFCEERDGDFDWGCRESVNSFFLKWPISTILILWIQEHGDFPFSSVFLNIFFRGLRSMQRSFTSLVRFIHMYFIFFETVANGSVSIFSFS